MNHPPIDAVVNFIKNNQSNNMVVAEIGVFDGATTKGYIDIIKKNNGHLYVIDWFQGNITASGYHAHNPDNKDNVLNVFKENLKDYLDIITILEGKTDDMIPKIPDESLDICFLDADHRYANVKKDLANIRSKIKKTGILFGHDFEKFLDDDFLQSYPDDKLERDYDQEIYAHVGVIKAVTEDIGRDNIELLGNTCWRAKK